MKGSQLRALFWDAFHQIVDNWVFRILAVLALLPGLLFLIFGLREDGIVLFFGLKTWDYSSLSGLLPGGGSGQALEGARELILTGVLQLFIDFVGGSVGILFCIAATAFFVPRMIEKGAADVLFHKPLSRATFYLSRFAGGVLFVALLSFTMVGGIYVALILSSGYHDPGILFSALSLTYSFALIFSVCMLIGAWTRSSTAAILLTPIFFLFNGCIHKSWVGLETSDHNAEALERLAEDEPEVADGQVEVSSDGVRIEADTTPAFLVWVRRCISGMHYVLPKTSDAGIMADKLRSAISTPLFIEEESRVAIYDRPDATTRLEGTAVPVAPAQLRELFGEPLIAFADEGGDGASYVLFSRQRAPSESSSKAAAALEEAVEALSQPDTVYRERASLGSHYRGRPASAQRLDWLAGSAPEQSWQSAFVFRGTAANTFYTLWIQRGPETPFTPPAASELEAETEDEAAAAQSGESDSNDDAAVAKEDEDSALARIDESMGLDADFMEQSSWYSEELGFRSPWRYNILFSIGSSVAFAALMLFLGWWKLSRIDF